MNRDYSAFTRVRLSPDSFSDRSFDVFVSAFNDSERVTSTFELADAAEKRWIAHTEYGYAAEELPADNCWRADPNDSEFEAWERYFEEHPIDPAARLAVDITGMMRPHLLLLPLVLKRIGFERATFVYSDPHSYKSGQATTFTKGPVERVAVVPGFGGSHLTGIDARDCLIIGAGYDHELVKAAAESKRNADHYLMVGMPGLQPHMYQESVYRVSQARESINDFRARSLLFAPANNPFMTAQVLSDHISNLRATGVAQNIYLCPVGPKTQVLGFAWYYLCDAIGSATSMVFPYSKRYSRETSTGLAAVNLFEMEFDAVPSLLAR